MDNMIRYVDPTTMETHKTGACEMAVELAQRFGWVPATDDDADKVREILSREPA